MAWIFRKSATTDDALNLYLEGTTTPYYTAFYFKEVLKQAGWVVLSSGDGSTYFSGSDGITHASTGAGGIANNYSWFRIRSPAGVGGREYTLQKITASGEWKWKYSMAAGFSGGSPSATQTPTATDQAVLKGAGTEAAPTGAPITDINNYAQSIHYGANASAPYDWYFVSARTTLTTIYTGAMAYGTGLTGTAVGDVDPWVNYSVPKSSGSDDYATATYMSNIAFGVGSSWYKYGSSDQSYLTNIGFNTGYATAFPVNPYTGKDETWPIACGRLLSNGSGGFKGWITAIRANMTQGRIFGDYQDEGTTRWLLVGAYAFPYSQNVIPHS